MVGNVVLGVVQRGSGQKAHRGEARRGCQSGLGSGKSEMESSGQVRGYVSG